MEMMTLALSRSSVAIVIVPAVFFFVYLLKRVAVLEAEKNARLDLIREALRSGTVGEDLKRELLAALAGSPGSHRPAQPRGAGAVWAGFGWIAFCVGIALLFLDGTFEAGAIVAASGFALLSLPIAMREAHGGRHA